MFVLRFIICASLAAGLFAADSLTAKTLRIEVEEPRRVYQGGIFPYLWVLRDGSALLQVAKGKRVCRPPFGFGYDQQDDPRPAPVGTATGSRREGIAPSEPRLRQVPG